MFSKICTIGPFTIYSYGLTLVAAFLVSAYLASKEAKKQKINPDEIYNFSFLALFSGIIGARTFFVVEHLSFYLENPIEIVKLQNGGLSWFGGLFLGAAVSIIYLNYRKLPVLKILDLFAPYIALGHAIGRIGCLLNGCCFGKETQSFGIFLPGHEHLLIPSQIYSSLALIFIFVFLRFLQEKPHKQGAIFLVYLLLYSFKRFFIEFLRGDNPQIYFGLTLFQYLSMIVFLFALLKIIFNKKLFSK